jgi:epoxyqueuosine reductase
MAPPSFNVNRRQFLKTTGGLSGVVGSVGLGVAGYQAGKDPSTYSGWQTYEGMNQTFDRAPWEAELPTYEKIGPTSRADSRTENIFSRRRRFRMQWNESTGLEGLDELLQAHYKKHPGDYEEDVLLVTDVMPKLMEERQKGDRRYLIAEAWSNAMGAVMPTPQVHQSDETDASMRRAMSGPPARSGGRGSGPPPGMRRRRSVDPVQMKSPEGTSKLLKKISFELGSTLVGITELNPDWVYEYTHPNRGFDVDTPIDVPKEWKYAVVVGTPMSWDAMYANPNFGTSNDAYSRSRIVAYRVASFIQQLGYYALPHTPGNSYDLMVPPIAIDAGLGEQGRNGILITPELGCNIRPAIITTNLPLKPDKPIDIGVQDFCKHCKICAENCPSGALTMDGPVEVRGYKRWLINASKCHNFWNSNMGPMGCRICISCCPYTRKANWLHKMAFKTSLHDPTGITDAVLTGLQERLYAGPDPQDYYIETMGGKNASYRQPPWWLRTEDFIDI